MDSRIFIAVFAAFMTCLVPVVFSVQNSNEPQYTVDGQLDFSVSLYKTLADSINGNFAVSTIDVFLGLLRLYYGSNRPTNDTLGYTLGVTKTISPKTAYASLIRRIKSARYRKNNFGEFMLYQQNYQLNTTYEQTIRNIYNGTETIYKFSNKDEVIDAIQNFHNSRFISTRYSPHDFGETKSIVLAGGGFWKEKPPLRNQVMGLRCFYEDTFHVTESTEITLKYTFAIVGVNRGTLRDIDATYLELNWIERPTKVATYIIFPNEVDDLRTVEKRISSCTLNTLISSSGSEAARISIPEFNVESKIMLKDILKRKIVDVFEGATNYGRLANPTPDKIDAMINTVTLRAFNVDGVVPQCLGNERPYKAYYPIYREIVINHPFLIVLVHKGDPQNGINPVILGMARYKPTMK